MLCVCRALSATLTQTLQLVLLLLVVVVGVKHWLPDGAVLLELQVWPIERPLHAVNQPCICSVAAWLLSLVYLFSQGQAFNVKVR